MHTPALLAQKLGLFGCPLDIAGKFLPREVAADDADAAVAQREHEAGGDDAEHHAHEVTEIANHEHDHYGKGPLYPGALRRRRSELGEDHDAKISEHAAQNGFRNKAANIG